ncbi:MAG TPA: NADPH-dependent FMN reductase [Gaiellaceae bacterium]|nr:NADPH-dependent FMN reductase [Gaiellaceae bacterium]
MIIVGISGSLRRGSYNRTLLRAAAAELPVCVEFREWNGLAKLPAYDEDCDRLSPAASVAVLRRELRRADALLIATPEYNHSVPGALKNALDWASRPFPENVLRSLPVAVIGASTGLFGAVWAQAELRKALSAAGADVLDAAVAVPSAGTAFTAEGRLRDPRLASALRSLVQELVRRSSGRVAA